MTLKDHFRSKDATRGVPGLKPRVTKGIATRSKGATGGLTRNKKLLVLGARALVGALLALLLGTRSYWSKDATRDDKAQRPFNLLAMFSNRLQLVYLLVCICYLSPTTSTGPEVSAALHHQTRGSQKKTKTSPPQVLHVTPFHWTNCGLGANKLVLLDK